MNIDELINKIVWWIPFKNKRNLLRDELKSSINSLLENEKNKINIDIERLENEKEAMLFNCIDRIIDLTNEITDINKQRIILKNNLHLVEIETHSYCNRRCWFCPNSVIDRHSENIELDEELYLKIINNLKEIDYSKSINFHRFNEPLSNKKLILKRISQARENLPNAKLGILTNADYLDREYLDQLVNSGINMIMMSYYFEKGEEFDKNYILNHGMTKLLKKLNLEVDRISIDNDEMIQIKLKYPGVGIVYKASDFKQMGNTRGGIVEGVHSVKNRKFRCFFPFTDLYIDYNGSVMPCCNLRSDVKEQTPYILGNIKDNNLFEIFTNSKMANMRKYLSYYLEKSYPCDNCYYDSEWKFRSIL
ncbi:radical SAM/SPASM domain-containing protein [Brachyspira pilosicoli]|uniref:radical SAM/SPASM domain-containing protein n=1 Tax=Brachyspira pilosicoli TaxID=52584 RepID=UPI0030073F37